MSDKGDRMSSDTSNGRVSSESMDEERNSKGAVVQLHEGGVSVDETRIFTVSVITGDDISSNPLYEPIPPPYCSNW